jgi:16S rRNA (uracil1498-N3)-methyltransferase
MRRFYSQAENFADGHVSLGHDETRHLRDVLRLTVGEKVSVFDGVGHEYRCSIAEITKKTSILTVIDEITRASPESTFAITIAATVLNGEKYDLIVQKAVELGVVELIPLHTARCDVKTKDAVKRLTRWQRIALEATKQTGRTKLMKIAEPAEFQQVVTELDGRDAVLFSERDGADFQVVEPGNQITALFGPKGGWDDLELHLARNNGLKIVTLGGRILRAETASIALTAILQHRFGDLK